MSYQSIFRPDAFANKVIIVTGGGSGMDAVLHMSLQPSALK